MKLVKALLATSLAVVVPNIAMADVVGKTSNEKIEVGAMTGNAHGSQPTGVGIKVVDNNNPSSVMNKFIDIGGLKAKAESAKIINNLGGLDSAGIVQLDFNKWNLPSPVPDHSPLGKFSYKELPNNVYFGEWHQGSTTDANDTDRTVFYVGKNPSNNLPTTGTATYQVTGINQYNGAVNGLWQGWTGNATTAQPNHLLQGTLTADFSNKTLNGTLNRVVNGGANVTNTLGLSTNFNATGEITGTAVANGTEYGDVNGHFFGNQGASVAGIAQFEDNKFDTAFGGNKQ